MRPVILKINLIILMVLALAFNGCSYMLNSAKTPPAPPNPPAAGNKYAQEIAQLKNVLQQNSNTAETKKAHVALARLYSNYKNPQRNYQKALDHLRSYVAIEGSAVDEETLNWMTALKEIDRLTEEITRRSEEATQVQEELEKSNQATLALQRTNHQLTREEIKLREKNRKLEEANQKLEKTIEMLKNLDQRFEEKKRNFTN
jgi:DNA repair exonuclease SbcCD ATPase subunit